MSQRRLQARVPSARFVAVAGLPAHRLRFHKSAGDGSAKCDAEETGNPDDLVIGVVYEIVDAEKPDLDRHEALGFGYDENEAVESIDDPKPERHGRELSIYSNSRTAR
ncbi:MULTISPECIES: gamma-glutamylcyclotransferase family protein [Marinobacter]|uniref:Gamma-glutamylcyclotransferase n=1 Tax=Marinobacter metalliresistant TaxID=2961995 RepID=A0ABZ2W0Y3_9GAMM|nr:gamma-glutamylcyclotransferase family protein [Marinobacter sp. Arc7-DN-1]